MAAIPLIGRHPQLHMDLGRRIDFDQYGRTDRYLAIRYFSPDVSKSGNGAGPPDSAAG
jgi:hypothetical protein